MTARALVVAIENYDDPAFPTLPGARADATALRAVLADPAVGGFEVDVLTDPTARTMRRAIESLFHGAGRDELVLLHLSGHGCKDAHNRLHLVARDTEREFLTSTGVDATFLGDQIESTRSRQVVLLLDCCYSGAFSRGFRTRAVAPNVDVSDQLGGRGRVVITAATALQFAHESAPDSEVDLRSRDPAEPSVFTRAVVEGLRTGAADLDEDGLVEVGELYDYVYQAVRARIPAQTPTRSVSGGEGAVIVARNPRMSGVRLPRDLRRALGSDEAWQRVGALHGLVDLLASWRSEQRDAALAALARLVHDPDADLARQARQMWHGRGLGDLPEPVEPGVSAPRGRDVGRVTVGIDFGTTNSAVAVLHAGECHVARNRTGARTVPSVAALTADGRWLVGDAAVEQESIDADGVVRAVKLSLGTNRPLDVRGRPHSAEDIAARILAELRESVEGTWGGSLDPVVLTVPAHFGLLARAATVEAARRAGIAVTRLLNEPTAAAMAFGAGGADIEETVMVVDLGGGTLDISLLEIGDGVVEVKAVAGDARLGGRDWDERIVQHVGRAIRSRHGVDRGDLPPTSRRRIREACEAAKIELSAARQTTIRLSRLVVDAAGRAVDHEQVLTRARFHELTEDLLDRCERAVRQAVVDGGIRPHDVRRTVLVGGGTAMPALGERVRAVVGGAPPARDLIPEGVVLGAALQAGVLAGAVTDTLLLDVQRFELSLELDDGTRATIVSAHNTIPIKKSVLVSRPASGPVRLSLWQVGVAGEPDLLLTRMLSERPSGGGSPLIEVAVDIDANSRLGLETTDWETVARQRSEVTADTVAAARVGEPSGRLPGRIERTPHSLGIEVAGGLTHVVVQRGEPWATGSCTITAGASRTEVRVLLGEHRRAARNTVLAVLHPIDRAGKPPVAGAELVVTFALGEFDAAVDVWRGGVHLARSSLSLSFSAGRFVDRSHGDSVLPRVADVSRR